MLVTFEFAALVRPAHRGLRPRVLLDRFDESWRKKPQQRCPPEIRVTVHPLTRARRDRPVHLPRGLPRQDRDRRRMFYGGPGGDRPSGHGRILSSHLLDEVEDLPGWDASSSTPGRLIAVGDDDAGSCLLAAGAISLPLRRPGRRVQPGATGVHHDQRHAGGVRGFLRGPQARRPASPRPCWCCAAGGVFAAALAAVALWQVTVGRWSPTAAAQPVTRLPTGLVIGTTT